MSRFGSLSWRLTFFYASVLTVLLLVLGFYVDRQLATFTTAELQDRLLARVPDGGPGRPAGSNRPPALDVDPQRSLTDLATTAARTDRAGVTTTVFDGNGHAVLPSTTANEADLAPALLQATLTGQAQSQPQTVHSPSGDYLVVDRLLPLPGGGSAVLQASVPLADVDTVLRSFRVAYGLGMLGVIVITVAAGKPLARMALRPLGTLSTSLTHLTASGLPAPVPVPAAKDELQELAIAFNTMLAEVDDSVKAERQTQQQLRGSQEQLRRFIGDASHELRSPLTALSGYIDLLLEGGRGSSADQIAVRMRRDVDRMNRLVQDLLALTRLDAHPTEPQRQEDVDLTQVAREIVSASSSSAGARTLRVETPESPVWVRGDPYSLERVFENLLRNAIQHTRADGDIWVGVQRQADRACATVRDNGEGIATEHQARIFDRFYRVDPARSHDQGSAGLGLAIVKSIVVQHGGTVSVTSAPGSGTVFVVVLPAASPTLHPDS
ncbi:MAG: HAMP domain-containing histidine kinase [Chloroflexi bacterium]|nr:HAMP domain-containing histidine kinase [Chloroflexota bacterium]